MPYTTSVKVHDADGDAASGVKVDIEVEGICTGATPSEFSDS